MIYFALGITKGDFATPQQLVEAAISNCRYVVPMW